MTCRNPPLPFLPGFTFNNNFGKTYFGRKPIFETRNNVKIMVEKIQPGIPGKLNERYPSIYIKGDVSKFPSWLAFNKETLCFDAYFQETLQEMKHTPFIVRKCKIYFFLEDGTVSIVEPKIDNSGIPQGTLLSRQRISLPPPKDALFFDIVDFNIGKELEIYGKTFKIVNCDQYTRNFLNRNGISVSDPINLPEDPHINICAKNETKFPKKCQNNRNDAYGQFLANDKKVLRFYGYWDERFSGGYIHDLIIYFYLADDNIEIREVFKDPKNTRTTLFIRKGKIPKFHNELPTAGYFDKTTTLNVVQTSTSHIGYILDPLRAGVKNIQYFQAKDLSIGSMLNIYGRQINLTDCDEFTKEYYSATYGINLESIERPKSNEELCLESPIKRKLPPWNGYGTHEDSSQNCISFEPKMLPGIVKSCKKFFALDKEGFDSRILRFKAIMFEKHNRDCSRKFILNFYLSNDSISINDAREGYSGPLFLKRQKYVLPGQEVYTNQPPDYYEAHHFFIGATILINGFQFLLVDADEYALRYMELQKTQFPKSNIDLIMTKLREKLKPIYKDFLADLMPNENSVIPYETFRQKIINVMGEQFSEHEMITLARHFSAVCRPTRRHSRYFIRQIVLTEFNRFLWEDLDRFKEYFRSVDIHRTGYLPRNKVYNLMKSHRLPLDKLVIENMLDVLEKNDKCEISGDDLFKFLDKNYCAVKLIAPINTKNEFWWPSEPEPLVGKLVDLCQFNKSLDLEYIFKEKIMPKPLYEEKE